MARMSKEEREERARRSWLLAVLEGANTPAYPEDEKAGRQLVKMGLMTRDRQGRYDLTDSGMDAAVELTDNPAEWANWRDW